MVDNIKNISNYDYSEVDLVNNIQLSILSPNEILQMSVVPVDSTEINAGSNINIPQCNGVNDPRMGPLASDSKMLCPIDDQNHRDCPGYFGHILLAKPVFWPHFMDHIITILKYVCVNCSSLLIDKIGPSADYQLFSAALKLKGKHRYNKIKKINSKKICPCCNALQPSRFHREEAIQIIAEYKQSDIKDIIGGWSSGQKRYQFTAEKVRTIFQRITDNDVEIIGLSPKWSRPEWMVCSVFPVPPPCVRPSVRSDTNQRSEDDLTHKLLEIVKANRELAKKIDKNQSKDYIDAWVRLLQYHITTYVNNDISGIQMAKRRSGGQLKSVVARMKGKTGRIRGNLMGKRVDYSARSVISPDPMISIQEVGVPYKIAMDITFPEYVTKYNIDNMYELVRNGPYKYPGAKYIKKSDGGITILRVLEKQNRLDKVRLEIGWIIYRHLKDGDVVLFNRQPSLHKMSMMGHKVRVLPGYTFRLQLAVVSPYNADFDGDEMNLHAPQCIQTAIELEHLCLVPTQIITPQTNSPCIGVNQDSLVGAYLLTNDDVFLTKKQMMHILMWNETFAGTLPKPDHNKFWTGKQLISTILPNISLNMIDTDSEPHIKTVIKDGILVEGRLHKNSLGAGPGGIVHNIINDFNANDARLFLDSEQRMVCSFLLHYHSFSVGISDCIITNQVENEIHEIIRTKIDTALELLHQAHEGIMQLKYKPQPAEDFELQMNNILNNILYTTSKHVRNNLSKDNRLLALVASKSKGKSHNISQIVACLGQQNVTVQREDGISTKQRIPYNYGMIKGGYDGRSLPHFHRHDDSPAARGFCENSFISGLNPTEFFFHNTSGREGLTDTAIKTSETGYLQRKLMKSMEDAKIFYDSTVRGASKNIIQFVYGDDSMDPTKLERTVLSIFGMDDDTIEEKYRFTVDEEWELFVTPTVINQIKLNKDFYTAMDNEYEKIISYRNLLRNKVFKYPNSRKLDPSMVATKMPFKIKRIIDNAKNKFITKKGKSRLNPIDIIRRIDETLDEVTLIYGPNIKIKQSINDKHKTLLKVVLSSYLSPKQIIKYYNLDNDGFEYILLCIKNKMIFNFIETGEMVGPVAAQSIGQPTTQLTLNTFHSAGISQLTNVTTGVARIRELIQATKTPKGPSINIYLKDNYRFDIDKAEDVKNKIKQTSLKDVTLKTEIIYDSNSNSTYKGDDEFIQTYAEFMEDEKCYNESPWTLRIVLNREEMMDRNIQMLDVQTKLYEKFGNSLSCIFSDDNAKNLIMRLRIVNETNDNDEDEDIIFLLKSLEKTIMDNVNLRGISGIDNAIIPGIDGRPNLIEYDGDGKVHKVADDNGNMIFKKEILIKTDGSNLEEILQLPQVDTERTYTNHITETYELLGIEATRTLLIQELLEILMEECNIDTRHVELLVDTMTNKGSLMSIDRFGINRGDIGPLARSSFEVTEPQFTNGSTFGEVDNCKGVSARIMLGQLIEGGTGDFGLLLDEDMLLRNKFEIKKEEEDEEEEEEEEEDGEEEDDCNNINLDLNFNISTSNLSHKFKLESTEIEVI